MGANSSSPLENPTVITNMIEMFSMMVLPSSCVFTFGHMVYDKVKEKKEKNKNILSNQNEKKRKYIWMGKEGRTIFLTMSILFVIALAICFYAESSGNTAFTTSGIVNTIGNMEGKEVRFGVAQSSLFTVITSSFTTGSVNNMHDSLTPLGGLVPLLQMMLNTVFGGSGVGLMNMLVYAILAVFICGLMIGRTPEYLSKKIEGKEMKLAALAIIIHPLLILGFSAISVSVQAGVNGVSNPGYHGLSQILYEFTSSAANNGSGFEGLIDNSFFWNIATGVVMFFGRYISIILQLAIAGSLLKKVEVNETSGTLKTNTIAFSIILVFVVYIFAALTFLPSLALGPIAEFLSLT
jgi:K+-transporting ATPase ATPase A chain